MDPLHSGGQINRPKQIISLDMHSPASAQSCTRLLQLNLEAELSLRQQQGRVSQKEHTRTFRKTWPFTPPPTGPEDTQEPITLAKAVRGVQLIFETAKEK